MYDLVLFTSDTCLEDKTLLTRSKTWRIVLSERLSKQHITWNQGLLLLHCRLREVSNPVHIVGSPIAYSGSISKREFKIYNTSRETSCMTFEFFIRYN